MNVQKIYHPVKTREYVGICLVTTNVSALLDGRVKTVP